MALSTGTLASSHNILGEIANKGVLGVVSSLDHEETVELTNRYCTHNYHPIEITITKGDGAWVEDAKGNKYIDCIGCYSALALGHLPQEVIHSLERQLDVLAVTGRAVYTRELALFLKVLCEYTGTDMACPMNTGAEAVETAIKLARKWAYTVKCVPQDDAEIIVAAENFHGRTTTIVGFSSEAQYREGFGPYAKGFHTVPFGDITALEAAIKPNTAAVLMEPIQAEGGILIAPPGYMEAVRRLCTDHNVLLIWDEIQTGFCRTGKRFAWQHEDAEPDMMCLGKALGGGVLPVAAVVGKKEVMQVFMPGDHGSTFGGNPLACVVAMSSMSEMASKRLDENSQRLGEMLIEGFRNTGSPQVQEVRGKGLLIGLEVRTGTDTAKLSQAFLSNGILTKETRHRTFRFAPPLNIDESLVRDIVARVSASLAEVR
jgi:ornithine--oxo-acid transaminase